MDFLSHLARLVGLAKPRSSPILSLLQEHTSLVKEATILLESLLRAPPAGLEAINEQIIALEKQADVIEYQGTQAIHQAILLPFDRSMLLAAFHLSDNVIDNIRKLSFELTETQVELPQEAKDISRAIAQAAARMCDLPHQLERPERHADDIKNTVRSVHFFEKEADRAYRTLYSEYCKFAEGQELYRNIMILDFGRKLEAIADGCEDFSKECYRILTDNS